MKTLITTLPGGYRGAPVLILLLLVMVLKTYAQEASQGNTTIFNGAEMTFFGDHNFATGGGGTQPGVINTIRTTSFGILNFAPSANTASGADDTNYVDGYVRKYGTKNFIFPVGDNRNLGPFAASGDGTMGAYYHVDPTSAVTSMLRSGNYPVLPSGGPFPSDTFEATLAKVSTVEYWDIDGSNATPLTLTWDAGSDISTLTTSQLTNLTITGWNGTRWVAIPSTVDVTSVLGGVSALSAGSITTNAAITPNTYTAYTFASRVTPLPVTLTAFTVRAEGVIAWLQWSTAKETNSDRFEIERSLNGKSWEKLGEVLSHRESKILERYEFWDRNPKNGNNLYRLRMVDSDETFAYSAIRNQYFGRGNEVTVYPNPASDVLFVSDHASLAGLRIINMKGQTLYKSTGKVERVVSLANLPKGLLIVQLIYPDHTTSSHTIMLGE